MTPRPPRDRRAARAGLAFGLALSLVAGGCSFYKIKPAPPRSTWPEPVLPSSSEERCSSTYGLPLADTIVGVGAGTITYLEREAGSHTITAAFGVASVVYFASAIYGYIHTSRCARYQALFRDAP